MPERRAKVLFVCIGNSCRSPMAEAIARKIAPEHIEASSAGLSPLGFVALMTKQTLLANGYPVEGLESKAVSAEAWQDADIIINMSGYTSARAFGGLRTSAKVEDWEIEDPYGEDEKYQSTLEAVHRHVCELAARLRKQAAAGERSQSEGDRLAPR